MEEMSELESKQKEALEALSAGNAVRAIELLRECTVLSENLNGPNSLDTAQAYFSLALMLFRVDRSDPAQDEVESFASKALSIRISVKGSIDASVALTADFLGSVFMLGHKYNQAEDLYRLSLDNADRLVGPSHINTAKAQMNLADVLVSQQKNLDEAETLLNQSLETRRRVFGPNSEETVNCLSLLASLHEVKGETEKAAQVRSEAQNLHLLIDRSSAAPNQQSMK
jgi:tetratricopeptide (TPR) repeat protein